MKFHKKEGLIPPNEPLIALPPNIVLAASHSSREIPEQKPGEEFMLSESLRDIDAITRDYSDYATGLVQDWFETIQTVSPRYGRIAGDPNRASSLKGDKGVHRTVTMGGNIDVWEPGSEPSDITKAVWIDEHHKTYYEQVVAKVLIALDRTPEDEPILFVDLHDTGDFRFKPDGTKIDPSPRLRDHGRNKFYSAVISDADGETSNPEVTELFVKNLLDAYSSRGISIKDGDVDINGYYKGGNVTRFVGIELPKLLRKWGRPEDADRINAIQLEIPRRRMMLDEVSQIADPELTHKEAVMLGRILTSTAIDLSSMN